jgi:hypothetical protein
MSETCYKDITLARYHPVWVQTGVAFALGKPKREQNTTIILGTIQSEKLEQNLLNLFHQAKGLRYSSLRS